MHFGLNFFKPTKVPPKLRNKNIWKIKTFFYYGIIRFQKCYYVKLRKFVILHGLGKHCCSRILWYFTRSIKQYSTRLYKTECHYANFWGLDESFRCFLQKMSALLDFLVGYKSFLPSRLFRLASTLNGVGDSPLLCISIQLNFLDLVDGQDLQKWNMAVSVFWILLK